MLPYFAAMIDDVEEHERREEYLQFTIERRNMRNHTDPFTLSDLHFKNTFRLTKEMVHYLIEQLIPHMARSLHPSAVEPQLRIFAALYFYANGSYQRVIGNSYSLSMAQNTVSNCITEVSNLIVNQLSDNWIVFPSTQEEKQRIKELFMEKTNFPGVIGAIDCTHVAIIAPVQEEHNYVNRKGFHSKNVQIICDYNLKIMNINPLFPGSTHDSYIWRMSDVKREMKRCFNDGDRTSWLLGDSGYPLQPWLMTPILNALPGSPQERYNSRHVTARNCIERCNGVLKARFRCLLGERTLRYCPEKVGTIIVACAVLHNICVNGRLEGDFNVPEALHNDNVVIFQQERQQHNDGAEARRQLIDRYFSNQV